MSSRRSRQQASSSRISDDQIIELVTKLRQLVPEIRDRRSNKVFQKPFFYFSFSYFNTYYHNNNNNNIFSYLS